MEHEHLRFLNLHIRNHINKHFTLEDRYDRNKCKLIIFYYMKRYCERYRKLTGKQADYRIMAMMHNGGPNGYFKPATIKYINRINDEILNGRKH